jgi:uncharacterized protein YndB with AHSA1/START domain
VECDIDLRPGGIFRTVMQGPEGERNTHVGCYLEVVPHERFAWTQALGPGFRPQHYDTGVPVFTAVVTLAAHPRGTLYTATAMHLDPAGRDRHEEMGFHQGWGTVLDQMVALLKRDMAQGA